MPWLSPRLKAISSLGRRYPRLAEYRSVSVLERSSASKQLELLERLERLEQASPTRTAGTIGTDFSQVCSKRWRASIRRSNGTFFPTIPGDSTGFEASEFAQKTLPRACRGQECKKSGVSLNGTPKRKSSGPVACGENEDSSQARGELRTRGRRGRSPVDTRPPGFRRS